MDFHYRWMQRCFGGARSFGHRGLMLHQHSNILYDKCKYDIYKNVYEHIRYICNMCIDIYIYIHAIQTFSSYIGCFFLWVLADLILRCPLRTEQASATSRAVNSTWFMALRDLFWPCLECTCTRGTKRIGTWQSEQSVSDNQYPNPSMGPFSLTTSTRPALYLPVEPACISEHGRSSAPNLLINVVALS